MGISDNSDVLTSIDIYLNAVNKIEINDPPPLDATMELNLEDILNDLHNLDK